MPRSIARIATVTTVTIALLTISPITIAGGASGAQTTPKPQTITLLTHDSFAVSQDVIDSFEQHTGITVKILHAGDAGATVNQAILTKDHPVADVLFGVDNTFLTRALDAGIFVPYKAGALDQVPAAFELDPLHRVTPIDYGDVCINYDKEWFAQHRVKVPRSLQDLTKPAYRGRLVVEDPSTSSPGLAFVLATISEFGAKGWQRYWKQLRANDVTVVDGWDQAYNDEFTGGGSGGSRPLVVSYASSPAAAVVYADPPISTSPIGTITSSCFRQVEFAGILKGTEHADAAEKLIAWMLSYQFQADVPLQMFVYPVRDNTPLPKVFTQYADAAPDPYEMSPTRIGKQRDAWIRTWTGIVVR